MKVLLLLWLSAIASYAQSNVYSAFAEETLSGTGTALSLQQPASPSKNLVLMGAYVYCSVACAGVTLEHSGAAATTTTMSAIPNTPGSPASKAAVYRNSNAGAGTVINKVSLAAGGSRTFEFSGASLTRTQGANYSIRVPAITGTAYLFFMWREE